MPSSTSVMVQDPESESLVLDVLARVAPTITGLFGKRCEVVVHDLRRPNRSIVHIVNEHVSGRSLGGPLIGGPINDKALRWLSEPGNENNHEVYSTYTRNGKRLQSSTVIYRNESGKPFAALCINFDVTGFSETFRWLSEMAGPSSDSPTEPPSSPSRPPDGAGQLNGDVDDILELMIEESTASHLQEQGKPQKEERMAIVEELDEKGVFLIKGAVQRVAKSLGVSKFTIYNDLEAIRGRTRTRSRATAS
jgi:predicted transcriptional regulator YheO